MYNESFVSANPNYSMCLLLLLLLAWPSFAQKAQHAKAPSLNWYPNAMLTPKQRAGSYEFCHGQYVPEQITPMQTDYIEGTADYSEIHLNQSLLLSGNVVFKQQDRVLYSDEAIWNMQSLKGEFSGNLRLVNPELVIESKTGELQQVSENGSTKLKNVRFNESLYAFPKRHLRGYSKHIEMPQKSLILFADNTLTYCEPGNNDWDLRSTEVEIDYKQGVARTWHTRLRVNEVPIFYFPYFSFPIDNRRITGFLFPDVTLDSRLQLQDLRIPFYVNLYANLDATIAAHYIRQQGVLWENEIRHKTRLFGDGALDYNFLPSNQYNAKRRWLLAYKQQGSMLANLTHQIDYTQISDNQYFKDMEAIGATNRTSYLAQRVQLNYQKDNWQALLLMEQFQTIDDSIALASRPYFRLPQIQLTYTPITYNQLQLQQTIEVTHFTRVHQKIINNSLQRLTGLAAIDSQRLRFDSSVAYPLKRSYGFIEPKLGLHYRFYQLGRMDSSYNATFGQPQSKQDFFAPKFSVDGGLFFDRRIQLFKQPLTQTFEPRAKWTYSPKVNQQYLIPTFDTSRPAMTYASLFSGDRFSGGDRLADLNQVSFGASSAFLNTQGRELWRFNLGQIYYLRDREVQLSGQQIAIFDQRQFSNILTEVEWKPTANWRVFSHFEYDPYIKVLAQQRYGVNYANQQNQFFNVGLNRIRNYSQSADSYSKHTYQIDTSAFWAITDSWAIFARQLRDLRKYEKNEYQPVSATLEAMLGLEYQNCCWKVQALYRQSSPIWRTGGEEFSTDKQVSYMLNIQFKGLGNIGSGINTLLNSTINGYSRRRYHDY